MKNLDIEALEQKLSHSPLTTWKEDCGKVLWKANLKYNLAIVRCKGCQIYFAYEINSLPPQKKYCDDCLKTHSQQYNRTKYHQEYRERLLEVLDFTCVVCGESFKPKRKSAKTCSDRCRKKLNRNKDKYQDKIAHPIWDQYQETKLDAYYKGFIQAIHSLGIHDPVPPQVEERREEIANLFKIREWVRKYKPEYFTPSDLFFR